MANEQHGADADGDNVGGVITRFKDVKLLPHYDLTTTKKTSMTDSTSSSSKLSVSRRSSSSTTTKQTRSITSSSSSSVSCCSDEDECSRSCCYDDESYRSSTYLDDDSSYYVSDYSRRSSCSSTTTCSDDDEYDNEYTKRMSKRQLLNLLKVQSKRLEALELENSHLKQSQQELLQVQRDVMEVQIVELANRNDELLLQIEERDMRLAYQQKQFQRQLQQQQQQEREQQQQQQSSCCCECQAVRTAANECTTKHHNCNNEEKPTPVVDTIPLKVDNNNLRNSDDDDDDEQTSTAAPPTRVVIKKRCCRAVHNNIRSNHQEGNKTSNGSNNNKHVVVHNKAESHNISASENDDDVVAQALDELRHEIIQLQKDKIQSQKEFKRKLASSWHQTELSKRKVEELETKLLGQSQREKDMAEVIGLLQYKLEQQQAVASYSIKQQQLQQREQVTSTSPTKSNTSNHPLSTKLGGGPSSRLLVGRPRLSARHTSTSSSDTITTLEDSYLSNESTTTSFFENARTTFSSFLSS